MPTMMPKSFVHTSIAILDLESGRGKHLRKINTLQKDCTWFNSNPGNLVRSHFRDAQLWHSRNYYAAAPRLYLHSVRSFLNTETAVLRREIYRLRIVVLRGELYTSTRAWVSSKLNTACQTEPTALDLTPTLNAADVRRFSNTPLHGRRR